MKICMLTNTHNPLDHRIFYKESLSLKKYGHSIIVIGVGNKSKKFNKHEIEVIQIKSIKNRVFKRLFSFLFLLKQAISMKADVYHCHDLEAGVICIILKFLTNSKFVFDVHEYNPELYYEAISLPKLFKKIFKKIIVFLDIIVAKKSDYIILVDENLLIKYKKINKNSLTIKNFISYDILSEKNKNNNKENRYILYIGGIVKNRGIFEIIKCAYILKKKGFREKFVIVGSFAKSSEEIQALSLVKKLDIENSINFIGRVPYNKVSNFLKNAKIGLLILLPSERYIKGSYPVKLFEYMYYGLPVIASDLPGINEIINTEKCGILVNPVDLNDIANSLIYLINNPNMAKEYGDRGRRAVIKKYNWGVEEPKLLSIYKKIL